LVRFGLLLCLVLATAGLGYYGYIAEPVQIAGVTLQPTILSGVSAVNVQTVGRVDNGLLTLEIHGIITDPSADRLTLITRAPASAVDQVQINCCWISGQTFMGIVQLGTSASPVTGISAIAFRLMSTGTDTTEAAGTLAVSVESLPGGGSKVAIDIIALLSLLATLITVVQLRLPNLNNLLEADHAQKASSLPHNPVRRVPGSLPAHHLMRHHRTVRHHGAAPAANPVLRTFRRGNRKIH
jgi:hypothetical protein